MKKILITGGASGLGKAITSIFAKDSSFEVYFTYANSIDAALSIEHQFPNAHALKCDFSVQKEIDALVADIGTIQPDILINNAYCGGFIQNYFHKSDVSQYCQSFNLNIIPLLAITQEAIRVFRAKKSGTIVTILTEALHNEPIIGASEYIANKAYIETMCKIWGKENVKYNISSKVIYPSFMKTHFTAEVDERLMGTITTPEQVALQVYHLTLEK